MKHTVDNHSTKFLLKGNSKFRGILPHPIYTDEDISRDKSTSHIIESNNISIRVMIEVLLIYFEKVFVVTKEIVNITNRLATKTNNF